MSRNRVLAVLFAIIGIAIFCFLPSTKGPEGPFRYYRVAGENSHLIRIANKENITKENVTSDDLKSGALGNREVFFKSGIYPAEYLTIAGVDYLLLHVAKDPAEPLSGFQNTLTLVPVEVAEPYVSKTLSVRVHRTFVIAFMVSSILAFILGFWNLSFKSKPKHDPLGMPLGDSQQDILEGLRQKYGKK